MLVNPLSQRYPLTCPQAVLSSPKLADDEWVYERSPDEPEELLRLLASPEAVDCQARLFTALERADSRQELWACILKDISALMTRYGRGIGLEQVM